MSDSDALNKHFSQFYKANDNNCGELINFYSNTQFKESISFAFHIVQLEEVQSVFASIHTKSYGLDGISVSMLSHAFPVVSDYIHHLVNGCTLANCFPYEWKRFVGKPIPKNDNVKDFSVVRV
ncbi:hypothetical protein HHI36_016399, partial [Cryptolaemus montrouzieri]